MSNCVLTWGGRGCLECGAEKPDNPNASGVMAERYVAYQRDRLGEAPLALLPHPWPTLRKPRDVPEDEPIRGWRMWRPVQHRGTTMLCAPYRPDPTFPAAVWQPGTNEASQAACWAEDCPTGRHPSNDCWCGLRAVRALSVLTAFHADQRGRLGAWADLAVAEVDLWGRVAGPARGDDWAHTLRASHARIAGTLYVGANVDRAPLAARYRVPVKRLQPLLTTRCRS